MTLDPNDPRITAYALNDPGLSAEDRAAVEVDPASVAVVADIRRTAALLTAGLKAEQAALPAGVTVPKPKAVASARLPWLVAAGVAASVVLGIGVFVASTINTGREVTESYGDPMPALRKPSAAISEPLAAGVEGVPSGSTTGLDDRSRPADGDKGEKKDGKSVERPSLELMNQAEKKAETPTASSPLAGKPSPTPASPALGIGGMPSGGGGYGYGGGYGGQPGGTFAPSGPGVAPPAGFERRKSLADAPRDSKREGESLEKRSDAKPGEERSKETAPTGKIAPYPPQGDEQPGGRFDQIEEAKFIKVEGAAALSTFGVDVDTASYAIVRKYLAAGQLPPPAAVRLEEIVNYFPYQDKSPEGDDPYAVRVELADCPWAPKHQLARIAVKARPIATDKRPPSNLVFLIDVSGSMNAPNRLPLVKQSLKLLVGQLGENDRVAMVVYAGNSGLVLDSTSAVNKNRIIEALDRLEAGGSTNGAGGLQQAYDVAVANFQKNGTNRVILCTDGDFNVGASSTEALVAMIEEKRKTNVFLSIFGFGMGNLRDEMMVKLAGKGNGNYAYIDTLKEANKALVEQASGTLVTVAKDVKIQVEFNPAVVGAYRLLGYEKRALATKDFADDTKDAGEMGAGHVVTALYELIPAGTVGDAPTEGLRYQPTATPAADAVKSAKPTKTDEAFVVKMRHKKPEASESTYRELPVANKVSPLSAASEDFRFSASAASFALLLQNSAYKGDATFGKVIDQAAAAMKFDPSGYRAEFLEVVRLAQRASGRP